MEHEVVVPMPAELVRQALQDPALLARCVPGLSTEPAAVGSGPAEEIGGRLKLRIGTSTITYRGVLSLIEGREGVLTVLAEGQEARGSGEATATVRVSVADGDGDGTAVVRFTGDLSATGRLTEFDEETLTATGRRLLDRFATALASPDAEPDGDSDTDADTGADTDAEAGTDADTAAAESAEDAAEDAEEPTATVVFLEDRQDEPGDDLDDDLSDLIAFSDADAERFGLPVGRDREDDEDDGQDDESAAEGPAAEEQLPAELPFGYEQEPVLSGPVRRSIVGRSAEEVDHAPPRGRYAPALPARSARARAASRWGGEAGGIVVPGPGGRSAVPWMIGGGVALIGGAVVLVRTLRRR
ncbi:SRPBCC domain-containing protein [Kitasatospora sp. NPDC127111]|uniref:SRPBCC domain-containing protein n=1 Tax=Kitasatospora sp. NPDC127111 TaxID=3345363 RepID=UPI00363EAAFB